MIRFKKEAIEKLLEERKPHLAPASYDRIKKRIKEGADHLDTYALADLCRELRCLPTDIVQYI